MADLRPGFREIVDGWMLIHDHDALTDRIEAAALWTKENGPLLPDEEATIRLSPYTVPQHDGATGFTDYRERNRPPPKHWITY